MNDSKKNATTKNGKLEIHFTMCKQERERERERERNSTKKKIFQNEKKLH